jgi:hypothetical protein
MLEWIADEMDSSRYAQARRKGRTFRDGRTNNKRRSVYLARAKHRSATRYGRDNVASMMGGANRSIGVAKCGFAFCVQQF